MFGRILVIAAVAACSAGEQAIFPADYATSYQQVRACRFSIDHNMMNVRVLASPDAYTVYTTRTGTFPVGAVLLKEEYSEADATCAGPIKDYTVMKSLGDGAGSATLGWNWQHVSASRDVLTDETVMTCTKCHADTNSQGEGYLGTAEDPAMGDPGYGSNSAAVH